MFWLGIIVGVMLFFLVVLIWGIREKRKLGKVKNVTYSIVKYSDCYRIVRDITFANNSTDRSYFSVMTRTCTAHWCSNVAESGGIYPLNEGGLKKATRRLNELQHGLSHKPHDEYDTEVIDSFSVEYANNKKVSKPSASDIREDLLVQLGESLKNRDDEKIKMLSELLDKVDKK